MTKLRLVKTNFTAGEIAPALLGRGDLRAYENGAKRLQNVTIHPTGGLSRRFGTYYVDHALGNGRLIGFEFNAEQAYLLVVTNEKIRVYNQGLFVTEINAPWTDNQIKELTWTQSADTVLLCHPDVPPQKLVRQSHTTWLLSAWQFVPIAPYTATLEPYYKFAPDHASMTPSATGGTMTLTCSINFFTAEHINSIIKIHDGYVRIQGITSPTVASCLVTKTLAATTMTVNWQESAFSAARGYPICAAFHQDRLVIGGSRDLPNRLWLSCSGDLWNFDKGTGLDSQSIEFGLFSDQINSIRALFSGRHLQVFTSGAEWIVTGSPLTPANIQLNRQTRIGSPLDRYVPPVDVDGATLFVGKTGQELREFLYTDMEQAYQANDLALLARHFIKDPVDQCFDPVQRILYLPLADGIAAALTIYRTENVFAWSRIETNGHILSIAAAGPHVYAMIRRHDNTVMIERFDTRLYLDCALHGETHTPTDTWSGLAHLNGRDVMVLADNAIVSLKHVSDNRVILDEPAQQVVIGLPYTHIIEPLPPSVMSIDGNGRAIRMVRAGFRLLDTRAMTIDSGNGLKDVPLYRFFDNTMDTVPPPFSGDISVRSFGWSKDNTRPLWRMEQNSPLPCTILGATMELKVND